MYYGSDRAYNFESCLIRLRANAGFNLRSIITHDEFQRRSVLTPTASHHRMVLGLVSDADARSRMCIYRPDGAVN